MTKIDSEEGELLDLLTERILARDWIDEFERRRKSGRPELGNS
jgi:hypothetical protein